MNPDLIITYCSAPNAPAAVIDESCAALERGAAIVHLDPREPGGKPAQRGDVYGEMILTIRNHFPAAVISVSISGQEQEPEVLRLAGAAKPDLATLTLSSFDFPGPPGLSTPSSVITLAQQITAVGIKPELECWDFGMISAANVLVGRGLLGPAPYWVNLKLGSPYSVAVAARYLSSLVQDLPARSLWSAAGKGWFQLPINTLAMALGGHCRMGMEGDSATNLSRLTGIIDLAESFSRGPSGSARARALLGLGPAARGRPAQMPMLLDEAEEAIAG